MSQETQCAQPAQPVPTYVRKKPHFYYDPECGVLWFATEAEALAYAAESLKCFSKDARHDGEWPSEVEDMRVGIVTHAAAETGNDDDGYDYKVVPLAAAIPAPEGGERAAVQHGNEPTRGLSTPWGEADDSGGDEMLEPLIYAAMMHNGKPKTVAEFERAAANVADMLQRRAEVTHNKPVASIYISDDGSREFDDWRVDLPPGNHQLFTAPRPDQPQPESLPHPGAPEAEEMIEKLLAECNRPSNMKNAARAGYIAAKRLLQHARQPLPATDDAEPNVQPKHTNPNNCDACDHKRHPDGGWCYMFRDQPTEVCAKHTARASLQAPAPVDGDEVARLARVAVAESEGALMVCGWMEAALTVCRAVIAAPAVMDGKESHTPYWQGGLSNAELAQWWRLKTKAEPTDRDMSCFALGVEVGCGANPAPKPEDLGRAVAPGEKQ